MQSKHSSLAALDPTSTPLDESERSSYLFLDTDESDSDEIESRDVLEELEPRPIPIHGNGASARIADKLPTFDAPEIANRLSSASNSTYVTAKSVRSSVATFRTATTGNFSSHQESAISRWVSQMFFLMTQYFPCIVSGCTVWGSDAHWIVLSPIV